MKLHQSSNKIIVTELNPMSEAPRDSSSLLIARKDDKIGSYPELVEAFWDGEFWDAFGDEYSDDELIGWLPIPVYESAPTQPDDFNRGIRVMFDYLKTRIANNFSGNPKTQAHLNEINKTIGEWLSDALREVSPSDYQEWLSLHTVDSETKDKA